MPTNGHAPSGLGPRYIASSPLAASPTTADRRISVEQLSDALADQTVIVNQDDVQHHDEHPPTPLGGGRGLGPGHPGPSGPSRRRRSALVAVPGSADDAGITHVLPR